MILCWSQGPWIYFLIVVDDLTTETFKLTQLYIDIVKIFTFVGGSASLAKEPAATNVDSNKDSPEEELDETEIAEAEIAKPEDLEA